MVARILAVGYFGFLLVALPLLGLIEKTKPLPASIADAVLAKTKPAEAARRRLSVDAGFRGLAKMDRLATTFLAAALLAASASGRAGAGRRGAAEAGAAELELLRPVRRL